MIPPRRQAAFGCGSPKTCETEQQCIRPQRDRDSVSPASRMNSEEKDRSPLAADRRTKNDATKDAILIPGDIGCQGQKMLCNPAHNLVSAWVLLDAFSCYWCCGG